MLAITISLLIFFTVGPYLYYKYKRSVKNGIRKHQGIYSEGGEWRRLKMCSMYIVLMAQRMTKWWRNWPSMYNPKQQQQYEDQEMLQVLDESNPHSIDCVYFYGGSGDVSASDGGPSFIVRMARRPNRVAELWFIVRLADGTILEHPLQPDTHVAEAEANKFAAAGFRITCLEPMQRWRLSYTGLMRRGVHNDLSQHGSTSEEDFVTLNLRATFRAGTNPSSTDLHPRMAANSVAREAWTRKFFDELLAQKDRTQHTEQWGRLTGDIEIDGSRQELDMHAYRDHSYGQRNWADFHRYAAHFGCFEDGTTFSLGSVSIPKSISHIRYGHLNTAFGDQEDIHEHNLCLWNIGEFNQPPEEYDITFITQNREHHLHVKAQTPTIKLFAQPEWDVVIFERFTEFEMDGKRGWGVTEFLYRYSRGYPSQQRSVPVALVQPAALTEDDKTLAVVSLTHPASTNGALCGGKGAQLGLLNTIQEVDVPQAVIITTKAYEGFVAENGALLGAISNLKAQCCNAESIDDLRATCDNMTKHFSDATFSDDVRAELCTLLTGTLGSEWNEQRVSVRSSAAGEDGEDASSAGQMQTFLGIRGESQIVDHIKLCWASQFSLQAVEYRRQHGQPIGSVMAVVVQKMVDADTSGVLFTHDPLTANASTLLINASYGLGEAIVSGETEPDTFVVRRHFTSSKLSILERKTGEKNARYVMQDSADGVNCEAIAHDLASKLCMDDSSVLKLASIGIQIEKAFGSPRDVEFAVEKGKVFILQARPITTFDRETDDELVHEFDSAVMFNREFITSNNIGEMCPSAVTPLTHSVFLQAVEKSMQNPVVKSFNVSQFCYPNKAVYSFCNQLFINLHHFGLKMESRTILSSRDFALVALFGEVLNEPTQEELADYVGTARTLKKIMTSVLEMAHLYSSAKRTKNWEKRLRDGYSIPKRFTAEEQFEAIDERIIDYYQCWLDTIENTSLSAARSMILVKYMSSTTGAALDNELFSHVALLLSSCEDVYSADVPAALKRLARTIAEDSTEEERSTFQRLSAEEAAQWCFTKASGKVGRELRQFLQRHGHRCVREAEFRETSWNTEPAKIVSAVKSMIALEAYKTADDKEKLSPEEALAQIPFTGNRWQRAVMLHLIRAARKGVGLREWGKSISIEMVEVIKVGYRQLGQLLQQEGLVPDADLVYFFTHRELGQVSKGLASPHLLAKATRRRRILKLQSKMQFHDTFRGKPNPTNEDGLDETLDSKASNNCGQQVSGMPVSRGTVEGTARVIRSLQDAAHIQKGEILIVPYTDVGWTPYFPIISGLVTEKGGLLSHGAVVAREYGIPCVVNARKVTSLIKTGNRVKLDGVAGTITILE